MFRSDRATSLIAQDDSYKAETVPGLKDTMNP